MINGIVLVGVALGGLRNCNVDVAWTAAGGVSDGSTAVIVGPFSSGARAQCPAHP